VTARKDGQLVGTVAFWRGYKVGSIPTPTAKKHMKLLKMDNSEIAKFLAKKIYNPSLNRMDFAIQLFVEKMTMLKTLHSYTEKDAELHILEALEKNKK
jgi:hypothetical protein